MNEGKIEDGSIKESMYHYLEFFSFKNYFKTFCWNEQNKELNFRLNICITRFIPQLEIFTISSCTMHIQTHKM